MNEKLERLVDGAERRAFNASKGPWVRWKGHAYVQQGPAKENTPGIFSGVVGGGTVADCDDSNDYFSRRQAKRNATFIARARTDVPRLCAAVRTIDAERERLQVLSDELVRVLKNIVSPPAGAGRSEMIDEAAGVLADMKV